MKLARLFSWLKRAVGLIDGQCLSEELIVEWWLPGGKRHRKVYRPHSPTNVGFAAVAGLAGNTGSITAFTYLALGTGSTAAAATDTILEAEVTDTGLARAAATVSRVTTTVTNDTLNLVYTWTATGVKILREIGMFNAAAVGILASRIVYAAITTSDGMSVQMTHKLKVSA